MFDQSTRLAIIALASGRALDPAALLAIVEVESAGKAFALVNGRNEPLIRFEGHYFDKRLSKANRAKARLAGLSSPKVGGVANPATQVARWALLNRAAEIDEDAAYESVSWGVGQVMGAHWQSLGYSSVQAMVGAARASVAGQVEVMVRFIERNGLATALKQKDWAAFARGYNGSGYKANAYDTKMAKAYAKYTKELAFAQAPQPPAVVPAPAPTPAKAVEPLAPAVEAAQPASGGLRAALGRFFSALFGGKA